CSFRNYASSWEFDRSSLVTTTAAQIEVSGSHCDFTNHCDPRNWSQNVPETWVESYEVDAPSIVDPTTPPVPVVPTPGPSWGGHLFEEAQWEIGVEQVSNYWNVLPVIFEGNGRSDAYLRYRLRECLGSTFLGQTSLGGVDRDTGEGWAQPTDPGWIQLY